MRIVLCYPVEKHHVEQIRETMPQAEVVDAGQERVAEELHAADIFCGHAKVPVDWEAVVHGGRLRWIQSSAAGLDHCLTPPVVASNIIVTSASGVLADQVSEHALALLLSILRSLPVFARAQQQHEFIRRPTRDLHETTVVLVGFGGVGRRMAEVLRPFRVKILATDFFPEDRPTHVESLVPPERLEELLPRADILLLAAPLTDRTRGMINRQTLALLPKGAILINVARGRLVVEDDLVEALQNGHLSAAGLDVTPEEPLPPTSRLWDLPNVIITPHVAGQSRRRIDQMTNFFRENLRRWQTDQPLLNLVDKQLGFPLRSSMPG